MAVTEQVAPTTRALHVPRPGRGARRFFLGALIGVVLVLLGLVAFRQSYAERFPAGHPGRRRGGRRPDSSRGPAALVAALGPLEQGDVTVRSGVGNVVIPYAEVGRKVDFDAMVDRAAALGRDSTLFAETVAGLRLLVEPVAMPPIIRFDRDRLAGVLAAYRDRTARRSLDSGVETTASGFFVKRSVNGVAVDTSLVAPAIEAALLDPATPASFGLDARAARSRRRPPRPTPRGRSRWPTRSRRTSS